MEKELERYVGVLPSERQKEHAKHPFYVFIHFGMNTMQVREWGTGTEDPADFTLKTPVDATGWAKAVKAAGASGIILTCKHHDGFCLFPSAYTQHCIKNSPYRGGKGDIVKEVSDACRQYGLKFGVYLSPWDMTDKRYGTQAYNDYFCNQLTELLSNYGEIFEVWFDGAKGKDAVDFDYDWDRYYALIRKLQPMANIAVCGPDIRWVGNEGGKSRKNEFCVVPSSLSVAERVSAASQSEADATGKMKKLISTDEDLGSRSVLKNAKDLIWYPAEVDVSISRTWFYNKNTDKTIKATRKLMHIYNTSVGGNCYLLLNVPPDRQGRFSEKEVRALERFGAAIRAQTAKPAAEKKNPKLKEMCYTLRFKKPCRVKTVVLKEDISKSQRVEAFELYALYGDRRVRICTSGVIGMQKNCRLHMFRKADGLLLKVTESRGEPYLSFFGAYC